MAVYQIVLGNFHTDKATIWHQFGAATDKIAEEKFSDELQHVLDRNAGDNAQLVKLVAMKYLED